MDLVQKYNKKLRCRNIYTVFLELLFLGLAITSDRLIRLTSMGTFLLGTYLSLDIMQYIFYHHLGQFIRRQTDSIFFSYFFFSKNNVEISCKLSPLVTRCKKFQSLFSEKL